MRDLHLRKEKACAAKLFFLLPQRRTAAVQPPIPESKDDHVREPEEST